ncbi:MAG TPA: MOSC domain-containing protein, partial [Pasteurellaceae bacterium]|nr:MOSC domain-containing protein [Pasteurellaceae bacterium]
MQICNLYLYPIKSTQAYAVAQALVQPQGLNFDREFMLTEPDGTFITARKDGELYHFSAFPIPLGLYVQHRDGSRITVHYQNFSQLQNCDVWGTAFASYVASDDINLWFSEKMGRSVQLRWIGEHSLRRIKKFPD